ncbi:MAG: 2OG-Fe(II) oxygenase [Novosphingobium sp.]|uniref:prolyl hydroxylase family protein n=1 Tax=Novosphingobium sp. TaxID=1874826 RepID=UPI003015BB99
MALFRRPAPTNTETQALALVGERVRARLDAAPGAYRLPVDGLDIYGVADFFMAAECARLIAMVDAVARPSPTFHKGPASGRTSYSGDVDAHDPFIRQIEQRIDALLGIEPAFGEVIQGQRYAPGQEFRAHYDYFDTGASYWPGEVKRGGQRSWTAMVYLNAVEAGGVTEFPKAPISVPPQPGALLVWNNMGRDGKPNPLTLHAGRPVEKGVKYIVTKWYRARPWF